MNSQRSELSAQLSSSSLKDRVLALVELQKETLPAEVAFPLIKQAIADENVQVRGMAVFALGIKQTPENFAILTQILETDADYNIRAMAAGALGYLEDARALTPLQRAFYEDTSWLVQFSAAIALGNIKAPQAEAVLLKALHSEQTLLQQGAVMALGEIGAVDAVEQMVALVDADDWLLRQRLAEALGKLPCDKSQSALRYLRRDAHPQVAEAATLALANLSQ
ncbi:MAG: HEAT repeat domain-containing protein [Leptolyngbya sp. SIO4C1]|nr:HEAT repeat domain-containing protein [Leptolyngbya sp. SIO4C1]